MRKKMLTLGVMVVMTLCLVGTAFAADSPTVIGINANSVSGATVQTGQTTATSVTLTGAASGTQILLKLTNSSAQPGDTITLYIKKANGDVVAVEAIINEDGYAVFTLPAGISASDIIVVSTVALSESTTTAATTSDNANTGVETNVLGISMIVAMLALASGVVVIVKKNI